MEVCGIKSNGWAKEIWRSLVLWKFGYSQWTDLGDPRRETAPRGLGHLGGPIFLSPCLKGNLELKKIALKEGYNVETAKNIRESIKMISSKEHKTIVLFGSLYFIGSALKIN